MPEVVARARAALPALLAMTTETKNRILGELAEGIEAERGAILEANALDVAAAERAGTSAALLDRLRLMPARIAAMADAIRQVAALPDPIGAIRAMVRRPNGMQVGQMRVPIGVILIIYEARPSVTVDAAALALKAGNAVLLRGGSEARHTLAALGRLLEAVPLLPSGAVQVLASADHDAVRTLLRSEGIDLVIPRGGESLIRMVAEEARMPVLKHAKGVCHLYVDRYADLTMAARLVLNAKAQRPAVCNALETLLVDEPIAERFLPDMIASLRRLGVEVRGDGATAALSPEVVPATEDDWGREYLDLILAVRVVDGLEHALEHIRRYSSGLADAVVTDRLEHAQRFLQTVDSAAVLVNASTRLVDGGEFGLGAEIGISTDRVGPRGPMGLEELTTTKWIVLGSGQVRE
jgi:glutamate-5-semialdehyde dehydrogenase